MTVIYFVAGRGDEEHTKICDELRQHMTSKGYGGVETRCLNQPHVIIAEVTYESSDAGHHVGANIERNGRYHEADKTRILCLSRPPHGEYFKRISELWGSASRDGALSVEGYSSVAEGKRKIDKFFKDKVPKRWKVLP